MASCLPDEMNSGIYYCCGLKPTHDSGVCPYRHITNVFDLKKIDVRKIVCSWDLEKMCKYKNNCMFAHFNIYESDSNHDNDCDGEEVGSQEENSEEDSQEEDSEEDSEENSQEEDSEENSQEEDSEENSQEEDSEEENSQEEDSEEENIQEENIYLNRTDETVSATEYSSETEETDLTQHTTPVCSTLSSSYTEIAEQFEQIMNFDENQQIERANGYDTTPGPIPNEIVLSTSFPKSSNENRTNIPTHNQLNEDDIEVESDTHSNSIGTNESLALQNFERDDEVIASTSHPSNNVNDEVKSDSSASDAPECGICLEPIDSNPGLNPDYPFGILPNCKHSFCLDCIKKWRDQGKPFEIVEVSPNDELWNSSESFETFEEAQEAMINGVDPETARSCPLCRRGSFFVVPSARWVKDDAEKCKVTAAYKAKLAKINCKNFRLNGRCRFNKFCFYLHSGFYCRILRAKFGIDDC